VCDVADGDHSGPGRGRPRSDVTSICRLRTQIDGRFRDANGFVQIVCPKRAIRAGRSSSCSRRPSPAASRVRHARANTTHEPSIMVLFSRQATCAAGHLTESILVKGGTCNRCLIAVRRDSWAAAPSAAFVVVSRSDCEVHRGCRRRPPEGVGRSALLAADFSDKRKLPRDLRAVHAVTHLVYRAR